MSTRDERWLQGTPNWVDLSSPDLTASNDYYGALFGWDIVDTGPDMGHYEMCVLHNREVAGIGPAQPGSEGPPAWTTYIAVDDADATSAAVTANGGTVLLAPMAVADQGRMAIVQDPTGAVVGLWQAVSMIGMSLSNEPGAVVWNEQLSRDPDRARAFYGAVFGYTFTPVEGEAYWMITPPGADGVVGGLGALPSGVPEDVPAHWMTYFMVESVDDAVATSEGAGGTTAQPPFDTSFGRMAMLVDPQGAMFSIMSPPQGQAAAEG